MLVAPTWAANVVDMKLREFTDTQSQAAKLAALGEFLVGRADDSASSKKISINSFINLAKDMGVSLTDSQLRAMISQPPLSNIITNVTDNEVMFKGSEQEVGGMSVDQARNTVDSMAKTAMKRGLKR